MNSTLRRYLPPGDDGISWGIAAAVLLAAVFLAGAPIPVAVLLSLIAYYGLALARSARQATRQTPVPLSDDEAFQVARTKIARLRELGQGVADGDVRQWIAQFADRADAILAVIQEDQKLRAAPLFLHGIVEPSDNLLQEYARLERRRVAAAQPILGRIKQENLPLIDQATEDFYQQLHRTDVIEIDTLSERLEYNLSDRLPAIARGEQ